MTPADFYSREAVEKVYLPECEEFVKKATGATRVIPFDYIIRKSDVQKTALQETALSVFLKTFAYIMYRTLCYGVPRFATVRTVANQSEPYLF